MLFNSGIDIESVKRYSRQIIVKQIGLDGQKRLQKSKVLIIGLGGLGSPALMYLAASGIGTIGIADFDSVEIHNLQRQVIHSENDIGRLKTQSAYEFVKNLNSSIKINIHDTDSSLKSTDFFKQYDIVLDCADNMEVRYTISDICKAFEKPLIVASVLRFEGQVFTFKTDGPCYRCLFPEYRENVQTCDTAGVLGSVCGTIGTLQATETIKFLLGQKESKLIVFDAWATQMQKFDISAKKKDDCVSCLRKEVPKRKIMSNFDSNFEPISSQYKLEWEDYFKHQEEYFLVDIRPKPLFDMANVKNSKNVPFDTIRANPAMNFDTSKKIAIVCKRGITAKKTCSILLKHTIVAYYISGGLERFKEKIDPSFPL